MKRNCKRILAVGMSCAMVVASVNVTNTTVLADLTTEQMVANANYNVALKKTATANPSKGEGTEEYLTDGKITKGNGHAATTFNTAGTFYEIDLGDVYNASTLDKLVVAYKEKNDGDTPVKGYQVQYSPNGLKFETVKSVTAADVTGQITAQNLIEEESLAGIEGKVRYIRLVYPDSYAWGIQATEIAVLDTDLNLEKVQAEVCDDAKSVSARSDDYNTLTYSIEAGENQEDYKYNVYLQSGTAVKRIGSGVDAGKEYTVEGVTGGTYQVKVVACVEDAASVGILSESVTVLDISSLINSTKNIANNVISPYNPQIIEMKSIHAGHTLTTAQNALDGKLIAEESSKAGMQTGSGSPQDFVINLGEYYAPSELERVILAYTKADICASDTKIEFSLDGTNYTEVGKSTGYIFKQAAPGICGLNSVALNKISDYTEKAVRFVRITLSGGGINYGYMVNEVAVIANTDQPTIVGSNIPEASDVVLSQDVLEEFSYEITAGEGQDDATYVVYMGSEVINSNAKAGVKYVQKDVEAGVYNVKVCTFEDGWLSKGITRQIIVDGYTNYITASYNIANGRIPSYNPQIVEVSELYPGHTMDTAQKAVDGNTKSGEGSDVSLRTAAGSPQYFVIDLGHYYKASEVREIMLEYTNAGTYASDAKIEFSLDRKNYTEVGKTTGYHFETINNQSFGISRVPLTKLDNYTEEAFRFVKITVSGGSSDWGYVINEAVVMTNTETPTVIESNVSEAAGIQLSQPKLETLDYTIEAGEDQEDATYVVSLGTKVINENAKAGVAYTYEGVTAGDYTVKVCQLKDGWLSNGIVEMISVDGYTNHIGTSLNLALRKYHPLVTETTDCDNYRSDDWQPRGQDISGGVQTINDGVWWNYSHHTGYLQTRPTERVATVIYDLGQDYLPEAIHSVISMYADNGTFASEYEILFSADGVNYESVYSVSGAKYEQFMVAPIDTSSYGQESVRYIKYIMKNGPFTGYYIDGNPENTNQNNINYAAIGYLLCELAVMGDESLLPEKVTEITATSEIYNTIDVQWTDLEGDGYAYKVYVDDKYAGRVVPGEGKITLTGISAGEHQVKIGTVKGEMERLSDGVDVVVQAEPTTAPTTTVAPTRNPETTKNPVKPQVTTKPVVAKPGKTSVKKITVKKKKASLILKKVKGATGYRVKYSTKKNMKNAKFVQGSYKLVVKKLKSKKSYYFAVQAYVTKNGVTVYGDWSRPKKSKKIK